MKKFLVLYRSPVSAEQQMASATPEQAQKGMEDWMAWNARAGTAIVDLGMPLGQGAVVGGTRPANTVAGFSIIQADSLDGARKLLKDHPHMFAPGYDIELHEFLALPGMPPS